VVAGELIEHLENPLQFLRSFRQVSRLKGKALLLSTPNATAIHNCLIALGNRESTHRDHLRILSFKTLSTLLAWLAQGCATAGVAMIVWLVGGLRCTTR
jgi:2-polyprenyl-3-methyl-5-hydroxy-6-metoxy-1,4-benzoquinol methylase